MRLLSTLLLGLVLPAAGYATRPELKPWLGDWQATASDGTVEIPFHFDIAQGGHGLESRLYNGSDAVVSEPAIVQGGRLVFSYPAFDRQLELQRDSDGSLSGHYAAIHPSSHSHNWQIQAHAPVAEAASRVPAPDVDGLWLVPAASKKKNEHAWRLIAHQKFSELSAAILGVGGDSGALTGEWQHGAWRLSNFSGTRAEVATLKPDHAGNGDLTLELDLVDGHGNHSHYTAYRPETAHKLGLPEAADLSTHTTVRDPDEVFAFSFPDLNGHRIANTDPRFKHKVVLVDVSGSWCPNCHDEAPFLEALYRKYHARGLEIVTLDFEDPDQFADPTRLRAFIQQYRTSFPVLLAGTTDQAQEKLPQAVNLDSWPTTFFIARDGRVKHIHTGFSAPATGTFHSAITTEFQQQIESLLNQRPG
ncbi:TlpA disulfide reductase family protein [Frateuria aurantia]